MDEQEDDILPDYDKVIITLHFWPISRALQGGPETRFVYWCKIANPLTTLR